MKHLGKGTFKVDQSDPFLPIEPGSNSSRFLTGVRGNISRVW